jgi:phosphoribosylamine---glycine ligase
MGPEGGVGCRGTGSRQRALATRRMRILVVGSGGREHAMVRALATAPGLDLLAAPGNPGTAALARPVAVAVDDVAGMVEAARHLGVDLVVPGPELPLVLGLGDALDEAGIPCAGPSASAARLEGSKSFTRILTDAAGVPSPAYQVVVDAAEVDAAIAAFDRPPVVKADGLAAGKGVLLPRSRAQCRDAVREILAGRFGAAGSRVVLEERLSGVEASLFHACAGVESVALPHARDHKRLLDGDRGPNTGGMGAISPNPLIDEALELEIAESIIRPTLNALADRGTPFRGFLFAGLMLTDDGPRLLEFNVRLGDPEAQAVLPRLADGAFLEVCRWVAGAVESLPETVADPRAVCAVVLTADGYPEDPRRGDPIAFDSDLETADRWFIHAATRADDGVLVTDGGRVGAVVARADGAARARHAAYEGVSLVRWDGMTYRTDIGSVGAEGG